MYRIERDSFGEKSILADKLYGINTVRAYENLSFSQNIVNQFPEYIKALAQVKLACAKTNYQDGILTEEIFKAIEMACHEILQGHHHEHFIIDMLHGGGGIGFNMNMNEVIANRGNQILGRSIGEYEPISPIDHVNASQSTADAIYTSARMAIIMKFNQLEPIIQNLIKILSEKEQQFKEIETIARTCLQDAMAISYGDFFSGYHALIKRRFEQLKVSVMALSYINLGGTVIGNGIGSSLYYRDHIIQNLNDVQPLVLQLRENLFDAAQNSDDLMNVSNQIELLAVGLIKISKDLRLLSSGPETGFGELILPKTQAGSSFFPGKVNPIIPETMIHCAFEVLGNARATSAVFEHGELNLNVFEGIAYKNIMQSLDMLTNCIQHFTDLCLKDLNVNEEMCRKNANSLIPLIVKLKELYGYEKTSQLLKTKSKLELENLLMSKGE